MSSYAANVCIWAVGASFSRALIPCGNIMCIHLCSCACARRKDGDCQHCRCACVFSAPSSYSYAKFTISGDLLLSRFFLNQGIRQRWWRGTAIQVEQIFVLLIVNSKLNTRAFTLTKHFPAICHHVNAPISTEWMTLAHGNVMKQLHVLFFFNSVSNMWWSFVKIVQ